MKKIRKSNNLKMLTGIFVCLVVLTFGIQAAHGLPTLTLNASSTGAGVDQTIVDNGTGDIQNTIDGRILFSGTVGNFDVVVTEGFTKPNIGSATAPELDLYSVQISSLFGASPGDTLEIEFSETGFDYTGNFEVSVNGFTDGTVSFDAYADASNALFGKDTTLASFTTIEGSQTAFFSDDEFSLTALASVTHGASSSPLQTSFDFLIVSVPELDTALLLGICLFGFVGIQWRRNRA